MRNFCSVETVSEIVPIEGADSLESARIKGWNVVVRKNQFSVGDKVVYIEIDAALPLSDSRFQFLTARGERTTPNGDKVHVLKTARLRGAYSQGIVFPITDFPEVNDTSDKSLDELLGVDKWDPPLPSAGSYQASGAFPGFIMKTDAERVQNLSDSLWKTIASDRDDWLAVEKLDGSSGTFWRTSDGVLHAASRNWELSPESDNNHWTAAKFSKADELLAAGQWLQGEVVGPGIQGNPLKLKHVSLYVFNFGEGSKCLPRNQWPAWVKSIAAPILDFELPETVSEVVSQVEKLKSVVSPSCKAEGVVWTHRNCVPIKELNGRHVFKSISQDYLLKADR